MKLLSKRRWKWLVITLALMLVAIALLPTLFGTRWIYRPLIERLAAEDFPVQIEEVRLRWLSPLKFRGVQVNQRNGPTLMSIEEIKTDRGLLGYFLGGRRMGRIELIKPTLAVELLKDGSDVERFLKAVNAATTKPDKTGHRPAIDIDVVVRQLSAKVKREVQAEPLVVIPPLDLNLRYRAASGDSHLSIEPTMLLNQVELTPELIDLGLGHALPVLAKSAWFDGRVSLEIGAIDIPLDTPLKSTGQMSLTLHQVRSGPSDPTISRMLDFWGRLRQKEVQHELIFVDGSQVDVTLADARVHHTGLRFGLPKTDSRLQVATSGSVGLENRSLDMIIELPVPVEQLARREKVQQLGVPTLRLPVGGTLDAPTIDWNAMRGDTAQLLGLLGKSVADDSPATARVLDAMQSFAEGDADQTIGAAVGAFQMLRELRKSDAAEKATEVDEKSSPDNKRPFRDRLRGLFQRQ